MSQLVLVPQNSLLIFFTHSGYCHVVQLVDLPPSPHLRCGRLFVILRQQTPPMEYGMPSWAERGLWAASLYIPICPIYIISFINAGISSLRSQMSIYSCLRPLNIPVYIIQSMLRVSDSDVFHMLVSYSLRWHYYPTIINPCMHWFIFSSSAFSNLAVLSS